MPDNTENLTHERAAAISADDGIRLCQILLSALETRQSGPLDIHVGDSIAGSPYTAADRDRLVDSGLLIRVQREFDNTIQLTRDGFAICAVAIQALRAALKRDNRTAPQWNLSTRTLTYAGRVVKQFRKSAPNQELLLTQFETLGWPARISDPLPRDHEIVPAERLRETIKRLNRSIDTAVLHFGADGTGRGVVWQALIADTPKKK